MTKYPTIEHENASRVIVDFFSKFPQVEATILTGSCARGKAIHDSCLDITVLLSPQTSSVEKQLINQQWSKYYHEESIFKSLLNVGQYSQVDLMFTDGCFSTDNHPHTWTSGADEFELEIGNTLLYSEALWKKDDYFERLKAKWLPYYTDELRKERLETVHKFCLNNIEHIPLYVERELYFQSFNRLYNAFQEFLQALFIYRRTYPISYDKWIKEQLVDILKKRKLYSELVRILEINKFESNEITQKSKVLQRLLEKYVKYT